MSTTDTEAKTSNTNEDSASPAGKKRYPYIEYDVNPCDILATGNSRLTQEVRSTRPELVADVIKNHGLTSEVSMIAVAAPENPGGKFEVIAGFHRHAACVTVRENELPKLKIHVTVHPPGTPRKEVLFIQGKENLNRVGLTSEEEGSLYLQLNLEGAADDEIADGLHKPIERVRAGRAVAANPRTRAAAKALPTTDLLVMQILTEFEDDEAVHAELSQCLLNSPRDFTARVNRARADRARRDKESEVERWYADRGYTVLEDDDDLPDTTAKLTSLCDWVDTAPLEDDAHAECEGRAVYFWITPGLGAKVTHYCVDYAKYGHRSISSVLIAEAEAELIEDGVALVDQNSDAAAHLTQLASEVSRGHSMTRAEHESCPGHGAHVGFGWSSPSVAWLCADYAAYGHVLRSAAAQAAPEADPAFVSAERKRAERNNDLWEDRKPVRREWLAKLFSQWRTGKLCIEHPEKPGEDLLIELPARLYHELLRSTILASNHVKETQPAHDYACKLLGLTRSPGRRHPIDEQLDMHNIGPNQALIIHLAQVLGAGERYFDWSYAKRGANVTWRQQSEDVRYHFRLLKFIGYEAEHVEQLVLDPSLDIPRWPHLAPSDSTLGTETVTAAA